MRAPACADPSQSPSARGAAFTSSVAGQVSLSGVFRLCLKSFWRHNVINTVWRSNFSDRCAKTRRCGFSLPPRVFSSPNILAMGPFWRRSRTCLGPSRGGLTNFSIMVPLLQMKLPSPNLAIITFLGMFRLCLKTVFGDTMSSILFGDPILAIDVLRPGAAGFPYRRGFSLLQIFWRWVHFGGGLVPVSGQVVADSRISQ